MQVSKLVVRTLIVVSLIIALMVALFIINDERGSLEIGGDDGVLGGEFVLQSANGEVALSDFRGKAVVLYFGFTHCPEVCPNSMNVIARSIDMIDEPKRDKVQAIMISIDPKRDELKQLDEYAKYFHPQILGITGEDEALTKVAADYGVFFEVDDGAKQNYTFTHTSRYFVINKQGTLVDAMRHSTTPNELAARIRLVL